MPSFLKSERNIALLIITAGLLGLTLANSLEGFSEHLEGLHHFAEYALALFFFVIGLELKHELTEGVFVKRKALLIPGLAAVFGALIPAGLYYLVTYSDPVARTGWAIPMATDITFALAVFSIFGARMPRGSKQFLLAFAIIDDLLAILVIAVFLRSDVVTALLVTGSAIIGLLIPHSAIKQLEKYLLPLVNLVVLPLYAFTALSITINSSVVVALGSLVGVGVFLRVIGKSIGISFGAYLGSRFVKPVLPIRDYVRLSVLGGIGFTVAFFVNDIVFKNQPEYHVQAILGSLLAAVISTGLAYIVLNKEKK